MAILSRKFMIFSTLLLNGLILTQGSPKAKIVLYDQKDFKGDNFTISFYSPDLEPYNWNNRAQSVCVTGTWLFYENQSFNNVPGKMEYIYGPEIPHCVNFKSLGKNLTSVRYSGWDDNYKTSSINFYKLTYFQGVPEKWTIFQNIPTLNFPTKSIIVTGSSSSSWTVYDRYFYQGNAICLSPIADGVPYLPNFIVDTTSIKIPHGSIRSVKEGCNKINMANEGLGQRKAPQDVTGSNSKDGGTHLVFDGVNWEAVTNMNGTIPTDFARLRFLMNRL